MNVVIVGGNECMECKYKEICKQHSCRAKIFTKEKGNLSRKLGCPDLMILFTNTVSHKMVHSALTEAKKNNVKVVRAHSSSASSLKSVLQEYAAQA